MPKGMISNEFVDPPGNMVCTWQDGHVETYYHDSSYSRKLPDGITWHWDTDDNLTIYDKDGNQTLYAERPSTSSFAPTASLLPPSPIMAGSALSVWRTWPRNSQTNRHEPAQN